MKKFYFILVAAAMFVAVDAKLSWVWVSVTIF